MTNPKDSQLDEIEREAIVPRINYPDLDAKVYLATMHLSIEMFKPGGLYYEMRRENNRLFCNTGEGCSVCGSLPVINVSGTYWLCGECVAEKIEEPEELRRENDRMKKRLQRIANEFTEGGA